MSDTSKLCDARELAARTTKPESSLLLAGGVALVLASSSALAAESTAVPEQVLITARPPDPVGNRAFSTTILDARELRVSPQLDLALRQVPGLSLFRRNSSLSANPSVQGVSLRSIAPSGAGRALVTLDGVPQNDPFGGWVIWSSLPSENIQSAEVVRGAGAGPYGAGALTGVIALGEREGTGLVADMYGGQRQLGRAAASGGVQYGRVTLGASGMYQTSGGWIPVNEIQRGKADTPVTMKATSGSLRAASEVMQGTVLVARAGFYDEKRDSGIGDTNSRAKGATGSVTLAHPERSGELGWRAQGWVRDTDLSNTAAAIGAGRATTTPSNDQYETPALGWGGNAAVRGTTPLLDWEFGVDARVSDGESQELATFTAGFLSTRRIAGGKSFVGGLYGEAASRFLDSWLFTAGLRLDQWQNSDGHIRTSSRATGIISLNSQLPSASGTIPTGRLGLRKDLGEGYYLRTAAYSGFRVPSLNELYRGFRLGNNFTLANSALKPEKLYGVEVGAGDDMGSLTWSVTGFWNRLSDAISNVTIGTGPGTFPIAGTLPAGGLLIERQNVGHIEAYGAEGEAQYQFNNLFGVRAAFAITDAHVDGGLVAAQITGKRPSQTPRWAVTGGIVTTPIDVLTLEANLRYESLRFSDDLNTLLLPEATTIDVRATIHATPSLDVYFAGDNLFAANVATSRGADGVVTYDAPRTFRAGLSYAY